MKLDCVTSLADLAFKAKTNKYYQQLVMLAYYRYVFNSTGTQPTWEEALKSVNDVSVSYSPRSCCDVVFGINELRGAVKCE
jgi:hypothetical protein